MKWKRRNSWLSLSLWCHQGHKQAHWKVGALSIAELERVRQTLFWKQFSISMAQKPWKRFLWIFLTMSPCLVMSLLRRFGMLCKKPLVFLSSWESNRIPEAYQFVRAWRGRYISQPDLEKIVVSETFDSPVTRTPLMQLLVGSDEPEIHVSCFFAPVCQRNKARARTLYSFADCGQRERIMESMLLIIEQSNYPLIAETKVLSYRPFNLALFLETGLSGVFRK